MTAINGTPRPIHPPRPTVHTAVRHTSRTRPSRRRAAAAITAALLAGMGIAIDAAAGTASATTPTPRGTFSTPISTSIAHLPNPLLGPNGIAPGYKGMEKQKVLRNLQ